jgi:DNA polymerase-3 subunit delta'
MAGIIGHKRQQEFLSAMIKSEKVPHAMIFEGTSKLGKRKVALDFVKNLFCQEDNCGNCWSCKNIDKETHPDVSIISPNGKEIKILQIRELIANFSYKPYLAPFKIAIIDNAHLMNSEAQNSILKLLEEPLGKSIIILITEHSQALLPTVRSRTTKLSFFPVNEEEIKGFLKKEGFSCDLTDEIALLSFGRPGVAVDFSKDPSVINERRKQVETLLNVTSAKSPYRMRLKYAKDLSEDKENIKEVLEIWLSYFRAIMVKKVREEIKLNQSFSKIKESIDSIEESIYLISRTNADNRLVLEKLIMEL